MPAVNVFDIIASTAREYDDPTVARALDDVAQRVRALDASFATGSEALDVLEAIYHEGIPDDLGPQLFAQLVTTLVAAGREVSTLDAEFVAEEQA